MRFRKVSEGLRTQGAWDACDWSMGLGEGRRWRFRISGMISRTYRCSYNRFVAHYCKFRSTPTPLTNHRLIFPTVSLLLTLVDV